MIMVQFNNPILYVISKSDILNHEILKKLIDVSFKGFSCNIENISIHYRIFSEIMIFEIEEQKTLNRI